MFRTHLTWLGFVSVAALMATAAGGMEPNKAVTADAIKWAAAPPALPPGAQAAWRSLQRRCFRDAAENAKGLSDPAAHTSQA